VLRLWPEHIRIGLGASYAALARINGAQVTYWRMQSFSSSHSATPWQESLATVSSWLSELEPRGRRIGIALSSELAPLHLLPWRDDVTQAEQQALLAADHFQHVYGASAHDWKTMARPTGFGRPWLAAAIDQRLLQALPEHLHGARLASLQPLAISMFNRITADNGWLLAPEPSRITALHVRNSNWALLRTFPDPSDEPITDRLLRETRLAAVDNASPTVYSPMQNASGVALLDAGWRRTNNVPADSPLHLLGGHA